MNFGQRAWLPWHFQRFFLMVKETQPSVHVHLTDGFQHFIKYADLSANGTFTSRFASHPRFPYWELSMK